MNKSKILKRILCYLFLTLFMNTMKAKNNVVVIKSLNSREQSIVSISALTAVGDLKQLKKQLNHGLESGLTIHEIKEILVHLYAYCGFQRSLNGINTFMAVLEEGKTKGITDIEGNVSSNISDTTDKYEKGRKVLEMLTKTPQSKPAPGFGAFAPRIDAFLKEHLFADIFESTVLTWQARELLTISALAAMTGVTSQLKSHIVIGKNTGLTANQLAQAFDLIANIFLKNKPLSPNNCWWKKPVNDIFYRFVIDASTI